MARSWKKPGRLAGLSLFLAKSLQLNSGQFTSVFTA
jgi:hypothetical protein